MYIQVYIKVGVRNRVYIRLYIRAWGLGYLLQRSVLGSIWEFPKIGDPNTVP